MPSACEALEHWTKAASLEAGEPLFRPITKGGEIGPGRLTDGSVSRIVKARVREYALIQGKSEAETLELVAAYSGHSMRAGYGTTAAMHDVPGYRIQQRMRHKSMDTTSGYIRAGQQWTKSGLKGIF
jgi:integrase